MALNLILKLTLKHVEQILIKERVMACDINGESRIRIDLPFTRTAFHSRALTRLKQVYEKAS